MFLNRKIGAEQPLAGQTVVGIKSLQPFHVVDPAEHFVSHIGGISRIKGGISDNEAACAGCRSRGQNDPWIFVSPRPASRTRNPFFVQHMSDRLRALDTAKEIEDTFDAIYRRPVYLSHSLANSVRLLRKASQSSGISNLIFSSGSPPGGGAAPCFGECR